MCVNKYKQTSSFYDTKDKEKTLSTFEKKEKRHEMVMFVYINVVNHYAIQPSNARVAQETTTSQIK